MRSVPVDPRLAELKRVTLGLVAGDADQVGAFQLFKLSRRALWIEDKASQPP